MKAVHEGVRAMQRWAAGLGMDPDLIRVFSDKDGPVDNHHGISGYLDHKVVAKRIRNALVEPARGFCGVLTG